MTQRSLLLQAFVTVLVVGVLWTTVDGRQAQVETRDEPGLVATATRTTNRCAEATDVRDASHSRAAAVPLDGLHKCDNRELDGSLPSSSRQMIDVDDFEVEPITTNRINHGPLLRDPDDAGTDALFAATAGESANVGPLLGDPDDPMTNLAADPGGERSIGIPLGDPDEVGDWLVDPESKSGPENIGFSLGDPINTEQFDLEGPIGSLGEKLPDPEGT
ncbi:MAG: hypothetical protein AAF662_15265 [Pseudomonadota bacterium]